MQPLANESHSLKRLLCNGLVACALLLPGIGFESAFAQSKTVQSESTENENSSENEPEVESEPEDENDTSKNQSTGGAVLDRVRAEREEAFNPYVITAHKHNFFLPFSYTSNVNASAYRLQDAPPDLQFKSYEVNFQISLKSQVNGGDLLFADDSLYFGITLESWWQLYNAPLSSPFRETNYQPEIFYLTPLLWGPFNGRTALMVGLEHQSNGQLQELSRSWNRVYAELIYERGFFVASLRPWYRLPEKRKSSPDDAQGDDNPDILDYMGHGELSLAWKNRTVELRTIMRGNTATRKGAIDATFTFPLFGKFRGMMQYFNGYGDSLIDYDRFQHRFGFGVALTNLF